MKPLQEMASHLSPLILAGLLISTANTALAELAEGFDGALAAPERSAEDRGRDAARKPTQVLEFIGIEAGMAVLDVAAGAGWYTEVLSAAVGADGHVISHNSFGYGPRNAAIPRRLTGVEPTQSIWAYVPESGFDQYFCRAIRRHI